MPQSSRIIVLVNAHAGAASQAGAALKDEIATAFSKRDVSVEVEMLEPDRLDERVCAVADAAARGDIDAVVVGGGDGSIRAVAEALAGSGLPLGILPLGTFNHFAKDLGLPLNLEDAIAVICAGETRAIDVAEVNGRIFLNNSSIGIYPYMVVDRERRRRSSGLQKWLAMLLAGLRALRHLPIRRLWIGKGKRADAARTPCLFVGNNAYAIDALAFSKRERLDQGVLWLCVAKPKTSLALLWLAVRSFFGGLNPARDLQTFEATTTDINTRTSRLMVAIDGEVEMMRPPLRYRIRPKDLIVFARAVAA